MLMRLQWAIQYPSMVFPVLTGTIQVSAVQDRGIYTAGATQVFLSGLVQKAEPALGSVLVNGIKVDLTGAMSGGQLSPEKLGPEWPSAELSRFAVELFWSRESSEVVLRQTASLVAGRSPTQQGSLVRAQRPTGSSVAAPSPTRPESSARAQRPTASSVAAPTPIRPGSSARCSGQRDHW